MPPNDQKGVPQTPVYTGRPDGSRSTTNTTKFPNGASTTHTTTNHPDNSVTYETTQRTPNGSSDTTSTTIGRGDGPPVTTGTTQDPNGNVTSSGTITTGPDGSPTSTGDYNWDKDDNPGPIGDDDVPPPKSPENTPETDETPSEDDPSETDTKCDASCKAWAFIKGAVVGAAIGIAIAYGMAALAGATFVGAGAALVVGTGLLVGFGLYGAYQTIQNWGGMSEEEQWETGGGIFGGILGGGIVGAIRRPKPGAGIPKPSVPEVPPVEPVPVEPIPPRPSGGQPSSPPKPPRAPNPPTRPLLDIEHVFRGEINSNGKPVGFHHRTNGVNPSTSRVTQITEGPNGNGVYKAKVEIFDPKSGTWKSKKSTFFPDKWSKQQVAAEVRGAYNNAMQNGTVTKLSDPTLRWKFEGVSPSGLPITGYLSPEGIITTAFPIFS